MTDDTVRAGRSAPRFDRERLQRGPTKADLDDVPRADPERWKREAIVLKPAKGEAEPDAAE